MSEKVIREIVRQSKEQPYGRHNGWIDVRLPAVANRDLSLYVQEAGQRGLLDVCDVSNFDSEYKEWKILDVTASGLLFLEETKPSRKAGLLAWTIVVAILIPALAWLIPVLISLWK